MYKVRVVVLMIMDQYNIELLKKINRKRHILLFLTGI